MNTALDTGIKIVRNVQQYTIGKGSISDLSKLLSKGISQKDSVIFFIDIFFKYNQDITQKLDLKKKDVIIFVETNREPTTEYIDSIVEQLHNKNIMKPSAIVGMGGGITLDVAKAVANMLTNGGKAKDYQGWDLVKKPAIYKVAIPTLSGTGAEATRTCVLINNENGSKLGMNSDFTVFDQVIMDPNLTQTVPKNQYFYTGMDAYIHCIEALSGSYRNAIGDSYSEQTIRLCREVFSSNDMMSDENRLKMMVASFFG